jgi:hypothetical protein
VSHNRVISANDSAFPQLDVQRVSRPRFRIVDGVKENLAILIIQLLRRARHLATLTLEVGWLQIEQH